MGFVEELTERDYYSITDIGYGCFNLKFEPELTDKFVIRHIRNKGGEIIVLNLYFMILTLMGIFLTILTVYYLIKKSPEHFCAYGITLTGFLTF